MPSQTTGNQLRYLLSNSSPLSVKQKGKFKSELHAGAVTIRDKKKGETNGKGKGSGKARQSKAVISER